MAGVVQKLINSNRFAIKELANEIYNSANHQDTIRRMIANDPYKHGDIIVLTNNPNSHDYDLFTPIIIGSREYEPSGDNVVRFGRGSNYIPVPARHHTARDGTVKGASEKQIQWMLAKCFPWMQQE